MNVLLVCANPKPTEESVSKQLLTSFFSTLIDKNADIEINNLDLYQEKPPFLSYKCYRRAWMPVLQEDYTPTKEEDAALHFARKHAEWFNQADVLVISTPVWNFSVPGVLKTWMDQILLPGVAFEFSPEGNVMPLHRIKKLVLLVASGHSYKEDDPRDGLTVCIRHAFAFIGINDIEIAWADGQNPASSERSIRKEMAMEAAEEIAEDVADIEV